MNSNDFNQKFADSLKCYIKSYFDHLDRLHEESSIEMLIHRSPLKTNNRHVRYKIDIECYATCIHNMLMCWLIGLGNFSVCLSTHHMMTKIGRVFFIIDLISNLFSLINLPQSKHLFTSFRKASNIAVDPFLWIICVNRSF